MHASGSPRRSTGLGRNWTKAKRWVGLTVLELGRRGAVSRHGGHGAALPQPPQFLGILCAERHGWNVIGSYSTLPQLLQLELLGPAQSAVCTITKLRQRVVHALFAHTFVVRPSLTSISIFAVLALICRGCVTNLAACMAPAHAEIRIAFENGVFC